jgi:hypothetical protein
LLSNFNGTVEKVEKPIKETFGEGLAKVIAAYFTGSPS